MVDLEVVAVDSFRFMTCLEVVWVEVVVVDVGGVRTRCYQGACAAPAHLMPPSLNHTVCCMVL